MSEPTYFWWLSNLVHTSPSPWSALFEYLDRIEFVWDVLGDENRAIEGLSLRERFFAETSQTYDGNHACTVLEMLIAFSERCGFQTDTANETWFWIFLSNLGIYEPVVKSYESDRFVGDRIRVFLLRKYGPLCDGGIFPIWEGPDMRRLELWFQFMNYLESPAGEVKEVDHRLF